MPAPEQPTVSVVIATRDRPQLVRETIQAVAAQDYLGVVECVVVHDRCEPDASLARDDARRPVRVVSNTRTPGLPGARNTGAEAAVGELLAFCDDDDVWLPSKLTRQVEALERSGADVCTTGVVVDYDGRLRPRVGSATELTAEQLSRGRALDQSHPSTFLVRRAAFFDRIGVVDEAIPGGYGEDHDWILRAAQQRPVTVVPEPLVRVRWGRTSFFAQRWQMINDAEDYLLRKHPSFSRDRLALAEHLGRKAFALAALGRRGEARATARRALSHNRRERRAYLALAVSGRLVSADAVMRLANTAGRGI